MMKSFFKKLAFVMALAMVVSMAAPAGSALAAGLSVAYQNGGAVSELNVKAGAEQDLKFLGAPKNWKDLGFAWTSSNEAVATVDQTGVVTAVADGTATITITVGTLTGSVVVNVGDAKAYDVTLGTADNKAMTAAELKKGASLDLNFYGVKDWNKNNYTVAWSVNGDAANVDKNGVVTAVKAGKAVVTASIVNNVTGVAHNVAPVEVTVAAEVNADAFTVAQKDTDKFVLTFGAAKTVDAIKDGLTVSVKIGDKDFPISFENITVDGNNVTVTTYAQFENEEVYTLVFGKEKVEYTIVLGDIYEVRADYYTGKNKENKVAYVTEEEENDYVTLVPVLYDKYGNNITAKYNLANFDFTYEVSSNVNPVCIYNDVFAFDAAGLATVDVTATWITDDGELKEAAGKTTFVVEKRGSISLVLQKAGIGTSCNWLAKDDIFTYEVDPATDFRLDPNSSVWNQWGGWFVKTSFDYKSEESRSPIYTAVFKDSRGNLVTSNDGSYPFGTFSYESTNTNVLSIEDVSGNVSFNGVGKANILVYFTAADGTGAKKLIASTPITVTPEVYPVTYKMMATSQTTASDVIDDGLNDVTFKVQFYDQFGAVYEGRTSEIEQALDIEARDTANGVYGKGGVKSFKWNGTDKTYDIKIDASDYALAASGNNYKSFGYKVFLQDFDVASTVKTPYTVFSLVVKNTLEEKNVLAAFIESTRKVAVYNEEAFKALDENAYEYYETETVKNDETGEDETIYVTYSSIGKKAGEVPATYKFNISYGGNQSVDVAVKNVIDYSNTWSQSHVKSAWNTKVSAKYLSSGNLAIAYVPSALLVDNSKGKIENGSLGYVYYKVNGPAKTTVAGATENNTAWDYYDSHGEVVLKFNYSTPSAFDTKHFFEDADGNKKEASLNTNWCYTGTDNKWAPENSIWLESGWMKCLYTSNDGSWDRPLGFDSLVVGDTYYLDHGELTPYTYVGTESTPVDYNNFKYAANGAYTVAFSTTRTEGGKIYATKTSSITVSNSESQIKYLGLNPDFNGVTEMDIVAKNDASFAVVMQDLIEEQLLFGYEEVLFGDYYDELSGWIVSGADVKIDFADTNTKISVNNDGKSVTISSLVFVLTLDDGNARTTTTHKLKVNVGVRIKEK